jgi:membrane protein
MTRFVRDRIRLLRETVELWSSRNSFQLAGALAFYALFSMAPLLIILIAIAGAVFGESAVRGEITGQLQGFVGQEAAEWLEEALRRSRIEEAGILPTVLGVAALLFGATTVFAQLQVALNRIWGVVAGPSRKGVVVFLIRRLLSLALVFLLGLLFLLVFAATMALTALVGHADQWVRFPSVLVSAMNLAVNLGVATVLFAIVFKVLPDVRIEWRDVWRGAFLTGLLFVIGQHLISLYLALAAPASAYGAAGSLVLVLMWVYYSSLLLFFGAAYTRVSMRHRGAAVTPRGAAVRVRTEVLMDQGEEGAGGKVE